MKHCYYCSSSFLFFRYVQKHCLRLFLCDTHIQLQHVKYASDGGQNVKSQNSTHNLWNQYTTKNKQFNSIAWVCVCVRVRDLLFSSVIINYWKQKTKQRNSTFVWINCDFKVLNTESVNSETSWICIVK